MLITANICTYIFQKNSKSEQNIESYKIKITVEHYFDLKMHKRVSIVDIVSYTH